MPVADYGTMTMGRSAVRTTLCAVLPAISAARSPCRRDPMTITSTSCALACQVISRAALRYKSGVISLFTLMPRASKILLGDVEHFARVLIGPAARILWYRSFLFWRVKQVQRMRSAGIQGRRSLKTGPIGPQTQDCAARADEDASILSLIALPLTVLLIAGLRTNGIFS